MSANITLHWWMVPAALALIGIALVCTCNKTRWSAFGWPESYLTRWGWVGMALVVASIFITIGGALAS